MHNSWFLTEKCILGQAWACFRHLVWWVVPEWNFIIFIIYIQVNPIQFNTLVPKVWLRMGQRWCNIFFVSFTIHLQYIFYVVLGYFYGFYINSIKRWLEVKEIKINCPCLDTNQGWVGSWSVSSTLSFKIRQFFLLYINMFSVYINSLMYLVSLETLRCWMGFNVMWFRSSRTNFNVL